MRTFTQYTVIFSLTVALLADCGGSQSTIGTPGAMPQNRTVVGPRVVAHRVQTASSSYKVLHSFADSPDGAHPEASLVYVKGALYGTTTYGGRKRRHGPGTVFSITTTGAEHVSYIFGPFHSGKNPAANLIGVGGILYGTTSVGGKHRSGTIFSITTTGKLHVLHTFGGYPNDGARPVAGLLDVNRTLYGTTYYGGTQSGGTVFSISTYGAEKVLHSFGTSSDGKYPTASLIDMKGTLYGTTSSGGTYNFGTAFSITPGGTETVLHSFGNRNDGKQPEAGLVELNGKLYGTTEGGGNSGCSYAGGCGTVFSITPGGKEKVLYNFGNAPDAMNPYAALIDVGGTLYGTTAAGGTFGFGTVFSITPTGTEELLHSFGFAPDAGFPKTGLTDENGTLYGTTEFAGRHNKGTVYSLTP